MDTFYLRSTRSLAEKAGLNRPTMPAARQRPGLLHTNQSEQAGTVGAAPAFLILSLTLAGPYTFGKVPHTSSSSS